MTTATKPLNYTPEQTAFAVEAYTNSPDQATVESIARKLGKTVRSVVAKLAKEGVYHAKNKEAGKRDMLKSEMVSEISQIVGRNEEVMESLEKATGSALKAVLVALREHQATKVAMLT